MLVQTSKTTRRKFLERSLWGFGSAFMLPSLLQSCTDHIIDPTDPGNPIKPPLFDAQIDWNDDAKTIVTSAIEMIPEAGDLLGGLLDIFWPSTQEDVWGQIKEQVEALVDQKIADLVYQQVTEDLTGLKNSITLYVNELKNGDNTSKLIQWITTKNLFVNALPHFQSAGNNLPLLPLFAQFANLYLALLRDGVAFGVSWGRTAADHQQDVTDLQNAISDFITYTTKTYTAGEYLMLVKAGSDNHKVEPFRSFNIFVRQMTQTVLDFMDTWPYFDVNLYPNGTTYVSTREIYSDPFGTCDDSGTINFATPLPTQRPVSLTVSAWDRIQSVQVTYPAGTGPGGVTTTPRMGASGGTSHTYTISSSNPILAARAFSGDILNALQFQYADGTTTDLVGSGGVDSGFIGYTNQALSRVHINGISNFYGCADCVVFGYQYWKSPAEEVRAIRAFYVKSPKVRSAADLAKAFPTQAVPANLITEDLKVKRKAYWEELEARAKALK